MKEKCNSDWLLFLRKSHWLWRFSCWQFCCVLVFLRFSLCWLRKRGGCLLDSSVNYVSSPAAILFECVQTIYTICPKSELLEKAAKCIGKFVLSPKINLKYLGKYAWFHFAVFNLAIAVALPFITCHHLHSRFEGSDLCYPAGSKSGTSAPDDNNWMSGPSRSHY